MKWEKRKPSYDTAQTYECEKYATITFKRNPFYGQKGRILKQIAGRHPDLQLEMPGGEKIRVDLMWTDDRKIESRRTTLCIDLEQASRIIQFLEYLSSK